MRPNKALELAGRGGSRYMFPEGLRLLPHAPTAHCQDVRRRRYFLRNPLPIVFAAVLLGLVGAVAGLAEAQTPEMTPREVHDRIVAVLRRNATRPIPAGDTLVTWSPIPNLYTTVSRAPGAVYSSLVRADAMVGTASSTWIDGIQTSSEVLWTQNDTTLLHARSNVAGGRLQVSGSRVLEREVPELPWAIADYGMEDQLLPLIELVADTATVLVYRPYADKWDTLRVKTERPRRGLIAHIEESDERWTWVISPDGVLIRLTRSNHTDWERRPLEASHLSRDYLRLREPNPQR